MSKCSKALIFELDIANQVEPSRIVFVDSREDFIPQSKINSNSVVRSLRVNIVHGGGRQYLYLVIQLLDISEAYIPNLSLLVCLEPFKKFVWWWWVVVVS